MRQVGIAITLEAGGIGIRHGIGRFARLHGPWRLHHVPSAAAFASNRCRLDGLITRIDGTPPRGFAPRDIPTVDLSSAEPKPAHARVLPDDEGAGRMAADHLVGLGLRHFITFVGFAHEGWQRRAASFVDRIRNVAGATCTPMAAPLALNNVPADDDVARYASQFASQPRPFGAYAVSDLHATHVLDAARMAGLRVPDDVAVIGTDNAPEVCELTDPPLSSVELNFPAIGFEAAELLSALMESRLESSRAPADQGPTIVVPAERVVARVSTDVLASDDADVVTAARFIRARATTGIDVASVLNVVPVSRRSLERRFRQIIGRTLHDEIQHVRLTHAKRLLVESDLSVMEVARASGFTSQSYFGRAFSRDEGVAPSEFRRQRGLT
jgi:LacI family transcriptional regulator